MKKVFFTFLLFFFASVPLWSIEDTLIVWKIPPDASNCAYSDFVFSKNDSIIAVYNGTSWVFGGGYLSPQGGISFYRTSTGELLSCYMQLPGSVPIFFDNDKYIALLRGRERKNFIKYDRMIPIFETEKFIHGIEEPIAFIPIDSTTVPGVDLSNFYFDNLSFFADYGLPYYHVSPSGRYVIGMWSAIQGYGADAWSIPHSYLIIDLYERKIVKRIPVDNSSPIDNPRRQEPLFLNDSLLVMVFKNIDWGWEDWSSANTEKPGGGNIWIDSSHYSWYALVLYNLNSDTYDTLLFEKDYDLWFKMKPSGWDAGWIWVRDRSAIIFPHASPQLFVSNSGRYILFELLNFRRLTKDINGWLLYDVVERKLKWRNTQLPLDEGDFAIKAHFSPDDRYILVNCEYIVDVETGKIVYELDRGHNWTGWLFNSLHSSPSHDWKYIVQLFLWASDPDENSIILARNPWYLLAYGNVNGFELEGTLHPNPTNGMVIVPMENFTIGNPVKILLSSLQGSIIKVLFDGILHEPQWMFDTADIPAGVYFVTIQSISSNKVYKLIVVK